MRRPELVEGTEEDLSGFGSILLKSFAVLRENDKKENFNFRFK